MTVLTVVELFIIYYDVWFSLSDLFPHPAIFLQKDMPTNIKFRRYKISNQNFSQPGE